MRRLIGPLVVAGTALGLVAVPPARPAHAATVPAGFSDAAVSSFTSPTTVAWLPNDRIVVLEQGGRLRVGPPNGPFPTALSIADICPGGERGLLGFAHDPAFLQNGFVYVYYTRDEPSAPGSCVNRVSRFTMSSDAVVPGSELVLLDNISSVAGNHNGGDLDIGSDGFLYVAVGDAGRDPRGDSGGAGANDAGQDVSLLNGKILRITLGGAPAPGNPFTGPGTAQCATRGNTASTPTTACQEIFAYGLRNPYRIAFDRNDGASRFFINDVGQGTYEEVNVGQLGANYGWPIREGGCTQGSTTPCAGPSPDLTDPITFYGRALGQYVTAGTFVPNGLWPSAFDGGYLFADGGSGRMWLRQANGTVDYGAPFATGASGIADAAFGFDAAGKAVLYYVLSGGGLRKITPNDAPATPPSGPMAYQAITPTRAYDTNGTGVAAGPVVNGTTRVVDLAAPPGVRAAFVNLTIADTAGAGYLRTWIAGGARPATSSVNAEGPGAFVANGAVVPLDENGRFVVEAATAARVIVDVMGWFTPSGATTSGRLVPLDPDRVVDTRQPVGTGNVFTRSGTSISVYPWGNGGAPSGPAPSAVVLSVAAISSGGPGYVGAYPAGATWGGTSNVNVLPGDVRANTVVVPVGAGNGVTFETLNVNDVAVDLVGYFTASSAPTATSGLFSFVNPARIVDTRSGLGFGRLASGTPATIATGTSGSAVLQNVTVTLTADAGFLTTHPAGLPAPENSTLNFTGRDQTRAVLAFTKQASGQVTYQSFGATDVVVDVIGSFS
jgi:glucose/arabinose dehydrogenase